MDGEGSLSGRRGHNGCALHKYTCPFRTLKTEAVEASVVAFTAGPRGSLSGALSGLALPLKACINSVVAQWPSVSRTRGPLKSFA